MGEEGREEKKGKERVTLFANAFLAFSISRVPPPAAPFSFPFSCIRLWLCSFLPSREKRVFFQDSQIPFPSASLSLSPLFSPPDETNLRSLAFPFFIFLSCASALYLAIPKSLSPSLIFCLCICLSWNRACTVPLAKRSDISTTGWS